MQDPAEVARGLAEIAAWLTFAGEPRFKIKAYEQGARVVEALGPELAAVIEQDRLRELAGIGSVLAQQIRELWNGGESELLARLRREHPAGAAELVQVESLTPRRIRALHAALGISSVEQLRAACVQGHVRQVPGFGEKTERRLLAACERWLGRGEPTGRRLILSHALDLAALLERELAAAATPVSVAGALRRGEETIGELELCVGGDSAAALQRLARLRQVMRVEPARARAMLADGIPLQLHPVADGAGNTLFAATGNAAHVAAVRALAHERGFELTAAATGATLPVRHFDGEAALYASVGLAWVPPELRTGQDEIERARHDDFADLIASDDIRGFVHCHTSYSDGKNSVEEMARAAHALGMQYITITDHSPSAHYAAGVSLDRLQRQWDEIDEAQQRVPIRILRGTESDILADGSLDFPDPVLERFDVIIASIHARHRQDRQQMTERLVRAMSLPVFKIWGHGLGRILNHRPEIDCDVPAVLDALANARGAVELNADPHRLDLPAAWLPAVRERGIPLVLSVDAHSTRGFGVLRYAVTQARRGGVRRDEVLNTRDAEEFARLVRPR